MHKYHTGGALHSPGGSGGRLQRHYYRLSNLELCHLTYSVTFQQDEIWFRFARRVGFIRAATAAQLFTAGSAEQQILNFGKHTWEEGNNERKIPRLKKSCSLIPFREGGNHLSICEFVKIKTNGHFPRLLRALTIYVHIATGKILHRIEICKKRDRK